ncbi:Outer membrane lipoprotein-sorting protein [Aliiroseovarius halocynthiae]|uniref:Outer membrane lipoprotein carrier protein LolA n=1 Tax=Aliiroseovarius halocynthiae TaxID=985055 RepID=A0A545SPF4_9RHOB|nr:outer membrane lipoprotein carrier protein LolA [Aliiroseovarius halocynthiae]TQV66872.1 outer membrane lipoprotein carrier protein LolA [Aliiroseovarius halocynthiae]SMR82288.1 Outer membrane lipoprotein-sorting protein [Aliiroseovarius halocynthiae]
MTPLRMTFAALALMATALPAQAEKISLNAISNYLNKLTTAKSQFTQINDDGTISTGTIYLKRPGRARFEYNPPLDALVVAGGSQVAIFDGKSNAGPQQYPLKRTPLNLILARNVDLSRAKMVVGHNYDGTATTVVAQDPDNPEVGTIELKFTANPTELRQWVITDNAGSKTTVLLGELEKGGALRSSLFSITSAISQRERR